MILVGYFGDLFLERTLCIKSLLIFLQEFEMQNCQESSPISSEKFLLLCMSTDRHNVYLQPHQHFTSTVLSTPEWGTQKQTSASTVLHSLLPISLQICV